MEVSRDLPTATVLPLPGGGVCRELQRRLGSEFAFAFIRGDETIGIELGGALKNVFAIPAGVSDGFRAGRQLEGGARHRVRWRSTCDLAPPWAENPKTFYGLSQSRAT